MPRWDFECSDCHTVSELSFPTYVASTRAKCPKCKKLLKRLPSVVQAEFVGKGFHNNDYPKKVV